VARIARRRLYAAHQSGGGEAEHLWAGYMHLTEAEASFRALNNELSATVPSERAAVKALELSGVDKRAASVTNARSGAAFRPAQRDIVLPTTDKARDPAATNHRTRRGAEIASASARPGLPSRFEFNRACPVDPP
jgi:hypothetical protein